MSKQIISLILFILVFPIKAESNLDDRFNFNMQLLSAKVTDKKIGDFVQPQHCDHILDDEYYSNFDCKKALEKVLGFPLVGEDLHLKTLIGSNQWLTFGDSICPLVEVNIVTEYSVFNELKYFGFLISGEIDPKKFSTNEMKEANRVLLTDGSKGIVHKFFIKFTRVGHSGSEDLFSLGFMPYIEHHISRNGNSNSHEADQYYWLHYGVREWPILEIDRTQELLK